MGLDADRTATSALIATAAIGLSMIIKISYPFNILRIVMIVLLAGFAATCFFVPFLRTVFGISGEFVPAMLTLVQEKPCASITVSELAQRADINRKEACRQTLNCGAGAL